MEIIPPNCWPQERKDLYFFVELVDCFKFEILYSILFLVRNGVLGIWGELMNPQIRLLSDPTSVVLWGIFSFIFIGEDLDTAFSTSAAEWPVQGTYVSQSHLSETSAGRGLWRTHCILSSISDGIPLGAVPGSPPELSLFSLLIT